MSIFKWNLYFIESEQMCNKEVKVCICNISFPMLKKRFNSESQIMTNLRSGEF